jgi:hypothetical protein
VDPGAIEESDYEQLKKELEVRSVLNAVRVHDIISADYCLFSSLRILALERCASRNAISSACAVVAETRSSSYRTFISEASSSPTCTN